MKLAKWSLVALALATGALATATAFAHGRHHGPRVSFGVHFGVPIWPAYHYPAYYPAPVYYQPAPVVIQTPPSVYVQRDAPPAPSAAPAPGYWYYCADSRAYYPYVKECPGGWQRVSPTPQ